MNYKLLYQIAQNTAGVPPAVGDGIHALAYKIAQNTAGIPPKVGDGIHDLFFKIAQNTAGTPPKIGDGLHDLLYKIVGNVGGNPVIGDGRHDQLYEIAGTTIGGSGGPPDSPDKVAGLKLWLKADAITGLSDGGLVSAWSDSSGNGLNLSQSGTAQPVYKANIINGKPAIRFDGVDDQLIRNSVPLSSLVVPDAGTIFVLQKQPVSGSTVTFNIEPTHGNRINLHLTYYDQFYFDFGQYDIGRISGPQPAGWNTGYHVTVCQRSGGSGNIWVDGQLMATTGTFASTLLDTSPSATLRIGADSSGIFFTGDIAELFVYNTALSVSDRQVMENYLGSKYNIPITH